MWAVVKKGKLIKMADSIILPSVIKLIDDCINNDEGGWKLTSNSNDPDGGWTFAGVTSYTWAEYYGCGKVSHDEIAHVIASNFDTIKNDIYEIYNEVFYKKIRCKWELNGLVVHPAIFSAAVNLGILEINIILDQMPTYTDWNLENFLKLWQNYYVTLVVINAQAWRNYANRSLASSSKAPELLRAENLKGWLNRIDRYRP